VTLVDKGRSPGGRLATRRIAGAVVDHGAQFFTARSEDFGIAVTSLAREGVARVWCDGFAGQDGHPRYVIEGGMNRFAKHLAHDLDVRCPAMAFAVHPTAGATPGWRVDLDDGSGIAADAVVLTCPLPQTNSLLVTSGVHPPDELARIEYDRTLALLAVLDRRGAVPAPGGVQQPGNSIFGFIGDNQAKGISEVPAITFHATAAWSEEWWDAAPAAIEAALRGAARPWLGEAEIVEAQVKRWRFATPRTVWPDPCWVAPSAAPLILAGDAFAGPRVEGAFLSGRAAAAAITDR